MEPFLDSRHLRLVAEVARTQSVTRAADRLHVTQSAVSHQLRDIEERLGTPLFLRSGRHMLLTAAGRHLVETAGRVLEDISRAEQAVARLARNEAGVFRVCTQCYTGYHWLPPLLDVVRRRYPNVEVEIAAEHTMQAVNALLDGRLDLAIVNQAPSDRRIQVRPLFEDEHAAIVAPSHKWAGRAFVTPRELAAERLYLYSRSIDESYVVQQVMRPAGLLPSHATFLQLTEAIIEMVKAGLGVSVLPTWSIAPAISSGAVTALRITKSGVYRQWNAATLAGAPDSRFLEHFLQVLARQGRTMGRAVSRTA
jgi:LysR family transcriptional regulator, regulator for metE and metH